MKLSFQETMRGEVMSLSGYVSPIAFHIRTRQTHGGHFELDGVVHAGPFGDEATCTGELTISLGALVYEVRWGDFVLKGKKTPTIFSPLRSMTVLPVTLERAGETVASGAMTFDLLDLPSFLASWLPRPTVHTRRFEARHAAVARRQLVGGS